MYTSFRRTSAETKAAKLLDQDCAQAFSFADYGVYGPVPPAPYFIVGQKFYDSINFRNAFIIPCLNALEGQVIKEYVTGRLAVSQYDEWAGNHWNGLIEYYKKYGCNVLVERTWRYRALGLAIPGQPD